MSERIPTAGDIRLALTTVGYAEDEAAEGIDRIKKRGIGIGHEMARETMQASIGDAFRKAQAIAWDEGNRAGASDQAAWDGWRYHPRDKHPIPNPYREGENDE